MNELMYVRTVVYPAVGAAITTDLVDFGGSTGVCAVFNFGAPFTPLRWGLMVDDNELLDVGVGVVLTLKKYLVPGSSTNAVSLSTITSTADVAKGSGLYRDIVDADSTGSTTWTDGTQGYVAPTPTASNRLVLPGQQLVVDLTDAADTSGKGYVWIQGIESPFVGTAYSNYTKVTS